MSFPHFGHEQDRLQPQDHIHKPRLTERFGLHFIERHENVSWSTGFGRRTILGQFARHSQSLAMGNRAVSRAADVMANHSPMIPGSFTIVMVGKQ